MLKQFFIKQGVKEAGIESFIRTAFPLGDYSKIELQRTPLGIKVIIHTNKPGRIIGKGGKNINEMTEALKTKFGLENPQLDVKTIEYPDLDPRIVAKQITSALERGFNYKKIGNLAMKRIMDAGAVGAEIVISGKMSGAKSMCTKFFAGYIKQCGQPSKDLVDTGFEEALTKLGKIGVLVKIMKVYVDITGKVTEKKPVFTRAPKKEIIEEVVEESKEHPEVEEKPQPASSESENNINAEVK